MGKVKDFQSFVNSLVKEDAKIRMNKKRTEKEEKLWLKEKLDEISKQKSVLLVAEDNGIIIGTTGIDLDRGRQNHIGGFGITIRKDYRGMGLGECLMREVIKLAQRELKPKPKIIRLSVFPNNKPAIELYQKLGFKKVAKIPKQFQYKGELVDEVVMLLYL